MTLGLPQVFLGLGNGRGIGIGMMMGWDEDEDEDWDDDDGDGDDGGMGFPWLPNPALPGSLPFPFPQRSPDPLPASTTWQPHHINNATSVPRFFFLYIFFSFSLLLLCQDFLLIPRSRLKRAAALERGWAGSKSEPGQGQTNPPK